MLLITPFCFPAHAHAEVRVKSPLPAFPAVMELPGTLVSQPCSSPLFLRCANIRNLASQSLPILSSYSPRTTTSQPAGSESCVDSLDVLLLWNQDVLVSFPVPVSNYPGKGNFKWKRLAWLTVQAPVQQWRQVKVTGLETAGRSHRQEQSENRCLHAIPQLTFPTLS